MKNAVLITGAAKRVGKALALHFAAQGFDIALHYHTSEQEAGELANTIRGLGVACELFAADLADVDYIDRLVEEAYQAFPHLNTLINNASVFDAGRFLESDCVLYRKQMRINTEAPIMLTQAFAKRINQGAVVNMLDSKITDNTHSHFYYLLSKKALHAFTLMAAAELGPDIRVNAVCPGFLLPGGGWDEGYQNRLEARLPLRKTATLDDVSQAVYSLATNTALTGQCLFLDGGESLL